jgi:hypothetical protein
LVLVYVWGHKVIICLWHFWSGLLEGFGYSLSLWFCMERLFWKVDMLLSG